MKTLSLILFVLLAVPFANAATLSRETLTDTAALEPTYANSGVAGDVVTNTDGKTLLHVKNPGASTATVTVTPQVATTTKPGFGTVTRASVAASLAAGEQAFLGPFPVSAFNNSSGQIAITYGGAGATDVDVAAIKLPEKVIRHGKQVEG